VGPPGVGGGTVAVGVAVTRGAAVSRGVAVLVGGSGVSVSVGVALGLGVRLAVGLARKKVRNRLRSSDCGLVTATIASPPTTAATEIKISMTLSGDERGGCMWVDCA